MSAVVITDLVLAGVWKHTGGPQDSTSEAVCSSLQPVS